MGTRIIFEYHCKQKQIMFLGVPDIISKKYLKKSKHSFIPKSTWINGTLTNNNVTHDWKKSRIKIPRVKNKPDLIVIFDPVSDSGAFHETRLSKIPVIIFNTNIMKNRLFGLQPEYGIPGKLTTPWGLSHLFFSIFPSILIKKKNTIIKKKFQKKQYKKRQRIKSKAR